MMISPLLDNHCNGMFDVLDLQVSLYCLPSTGVLGQTMTGLGGIGVGIGPIVGDSVVGTAVGVTVGISVNVVGVGEGIVV